jgi:hypothetical protein
MKKQDTLRQWKELPENLPIMPHFRALPYRATGSKYGACGIRIDGSPEFVDAVLSRLKDLIDGENWRVIKSTGQHLASHFPIRKPVLSAAISACMSAGMREKLHQPYLIST